MRKILLTSITLVFVAATASQLRAQQIPFINELFDRFETFNRLYRVKQHEGSNLAAIEPLRKRGEESFKRGSIPDIIEIESEAIATLQGKAWDDKQRFISSLTLETDRLIVEPNAELGVSLTRMFTTDTSKAFASSPTVTFEVVEAESSKDRTGAPGGKLSKPLPIGDRVTIGEASSGAGRRLLLSDGLYFVVARVEAAGSTLIELKKPIYAISNFSDTVTQLSRQIANIKGSADSAAKAVGHLTATAEFQLERVAALNKSRGEYELDPFKELDRIESEISQLIKGRNPFSRERGEIERAYFSPDRKLVPFRIYVPNSYDASAAHPLVVLLHGAFGDERYYFSGLFDPAVIKGEAERRGWILAAVNARGRFGGYRDLSLEDTFEVIKAVVRDYNIDASRVYLTGHSMGGFGAWLVASAKPETFAAIAPVSGGPPVQGDNLTNLLSRLKNTPALIVHGARDGIVSPEQSKAMLGAARKAGLKVDYLDSPETDHIGVVAATFPAILDFFAKNTRSLPEK